MCTSPLFAIRYIDRDKDTGKHIVKIQRSNVYSVDELKPLFALGEKDRFLVPCGKCIECRLAYSRMWANRIMLETQSYEHNYFVTLTYDNDHLPINEKVDDEGTLFHSETLVPDHLKKFLKDLRRYYKYHYDHENIRFYAAGEYGDQSNRPHYHLILFNLPIYDKVELYRADGYQVFTSDIIENIWSRGLVSVEEACWENAAYVARYVVKKQKGPKAQEYYSERNIEPEFVRMSRMPGIGLDYYEKHKDEIYKYDGIVIKNGKGESHVVKPGKYFDSKYEEVDPERLQFLKAQRIKAVVSGQEHLERNTDITWREWLKDQERRKEKQTKILLNRNLKEF